MHVEISTSDPDVVDPAEVAAVLEAINFFVAEVSVNDGERRWVHPDFATEANLQGLQ